MDFFKLRVINTLLFLCLGAALGYLLSRGAGAPAMPEPPAASAGDAMRHGVPVQSRQPADEIFNPEHPAAASAAPKSSGEPDGEYELELPAEPPASAGDTVPRGVSVQPSSVTDDDDFVVRGKAVSFFRDPSRFSGAELELELQMITAKRLTGSWRLNFLHSGAARQLDYIYIDDDRVLGEAPDLRIGYFYLVRFKCQNGELSSGNRLVFAKATGGKASWATGISAVE
ncbi:MAG: hypothetical protein FD189_971 [Elusimicrobia bacterium]|nr:MAG: hypothetical protein FD154_991 [Elusimicrobiota bacterium]KAF0156626.1 MAG: hypothetical protein FD189_971 [Elusimicrobiota bacterium]